MLRGLVGFMVMVAVFGTIFYWMFTPEVQSTEDLQVPPDVAIMQCRLEAYLAEGEITKDEYRHTFMTVMSLRTKYDYNYSAKVLLEQEYPLVPEYFGKCGKEWGLYEAWVQAQWEKESKELANE